MCKTGAVLCDAVTGGWRSDGRSFVISEYEAVGHQLAALNTKARCLHSADAACLARLEHAARRQATGLNPVIRCRR